MPTTHHNDRRLARRPLVDHYAGKRPDPAITPAQRNFIYKLLDEKQVELKEGETLESVRNQVWLLTKPVASRWINKLKALPFKPKPEQLAIELDFSEVPDGRYAVNVTEGAALEFFRIKRGRNKVLVFRQASDEYHMLRNPSRQAAVLRAIQAVGAKAASARYGHELGKCGVCGRTLTDADSRARGIGPKCARIHGWV